jgi:DNA-binding PadR family transcriptional regulator
MKQVEADSQGTVKMGPGTLYGSIGRMSEAGLVRESGKRVDPEMDDERRIYYELTGAGRAALEAELQRYRGVVAVAKARLAEGRLSHGH